jgi:hypothetical protein
MLQSSIPPKFPLIFASNAGPSYIRPIPVSSQIGITPGEASLYDGFVPLNATPVGAGGIPPFMQDFNGILNQITAWSQWQNAGGTVSYDSAFSSAVGGYPAGAILAAATSGYFWYSLIDNNTSDPEAGGSTWLSFSVSGSATTGDVKWRPTAETIPGWVVANALTIGNASSGATGRANADTFALFKWHWTYFSNTQCPVSGGRGANPTADFNANKTIQLIDLRGTGQVGMDTMAGGATTRLNGVPAVSGSTTQPGSVLGENIRTIAQAELPAAALSVSVSGSVSGSVNTSPNSVNQGFSSSTTGGGAFPFNVPTANGPVTSTGGMSGSMTGVTSNMGSSGQGNNTSRVMTGTLYLKL